ncbi:MAG: hypothetical protein MI796_08125 [Enterobacterales bacterium]|nr:hypothetical protein [Enterobacterales bacterium]
MKSCRIEINGLEAFDVGANIEDALEIRIEKLQNSESFVLSVTSFSVGDTLICFNQTGHFNNGI